MSKISWTTQRTFLLDFLRRLVLRRRLRFFASTVVPSAVTLATLTVFGRRRRRLVLRTPVFFLRFVVRRFLHFVPAFFDAFLFLILDALVSVSALPAGNEGAAMSASSYNSIENCLNTGTVVEAKIQVKVGYF